MIGTDLCVNKPHLSRSYLNHLVFNGSKETKYIKYVSFPWPRFGSHSSFLTLAFFCELYFEKEFIKQGLLSSLPNHKTSKSVCLEKIPSAVSRSCRKHSNIHLMVYYKHPAELHPVIWTAYRKV